MVWVFSVLLGKWGFLLWKGGNLLIVIIVFMFKFLIIWKL